MVTPAAIVIFGIGLLATSRLHAAANQRSGAGVLRNLPRVVQRLFGTRQNGVPLDDIIIAMIGLSWVVGGCGLAVTAQTRGSLLFDEVLTVLVTLFVTGGIVAAGVWIRRELGSR